MCGLNARRRSLPAPVGAQRYATGHAHQLPSSVDRAIFCFGRLQNLLCRWLSRGKPWRGCTQGGKACCMSHEASSRMCSGALAHIRCMGRARMNARHWAVRRRQAPTVCRHDTYTTHTAIKSRPCTRQGQGPWTCACDNQYRPLLQVQRTCWKCSPHTTHSTRSAHQQRTTASRVRACSSSTGRRMHVASVSRPGRISAQAATHVLERARHRPAAAHGCTCRVMTSSHST